MWRETLITCSVANALESCREVDGFSDSHLRDMKVVLIDVSRRLLRNEATQLHAIVLYLSRHLEAADAELPCERLEEGGLAAARGSKQKRQPGRLDHAADAVEDAHPRLLAVVEAQHGAHHLIHIWNNGCIVTDVQESELPTRREC